MKVSADKDPRSPATAGVPGNTLVLAMSDILDEMVKSGWVSSEGIGSVNTLKRGVNMIGELNQRLVAKCDNLRQTVWDYQRELSEIRRDARSKEVAKIEADVARSLKYSASRRIDEAVRAEDAVHGTLDDIIRVNRYLATHVAQLRDLVGKIHRRMVVSPKSRRRKAKSDSVGA